MNDDETRAREALWAALRAVAPETDPATIAPDRELREALDLDSIDFLRAVTALSKSLAFEVPERDYAELATTSRAVAYLARRMRREP